MTSSNMPAPNTSTTPRADLSEGGIQGLLGYQFAQAAVLTTDTFIAVVGKPLDLRKLEYTALQLIAKNAGVTATQIAKALAISVPGVTIWLDKLEARGLIVRERSGTDRRTQHLMPAATGRELVASALEQLRSAEAELLRHLTPGERQLLLELLHKFACLRRPLPTKGRETPA